MLLFLYFNYSITVKIIKVNMKFSTFDVNTPTETAQNSLSQKSILIIFIKMIKYINFLSIFYSLWSS